VNAVIADRRPRSVLITSADLVVACAAMSASAAAIHLSAAAPHWEATHLFGGAFVVIAIAQIIWALAVSVRPTRRVLISGAVVNAAIVAIWVMSRTTGLPLGPEAGIAEGIGWTDAIATIEELLIVGGVVAILRSTSSEREGGSVWPSSTRVPRSVAIVVAVGVVGVATIGGVRAAANPDHVHRAESVGDCIHGPCPGAALGPVVPVKAATVGTGVEVLRVSLTAGGGMVDVRYRIDDAAQAGRSLGAHGVSLVDRSTGELLATPFMAHHAANANPHEGASYYALLINPEGAVRRGATVDVVVGDIRVGPVVVG
jgi:hypothetical protein